MSAPLSHRTPSIAITSDETSTTSEPAVVAASLDALAVLFADAPGGLEAFLGIFDATVRGEFDRLENFLAVEDAAGIIAAAHRLAGTSLQIGAQGLGATCKRIEAAAKAGDVTEARRRARALPDVILAVNHSLREYEKNAALARTV
ncbi:MAG: Hpt domain-containing protein [Gemmatimonadaceae bacterium]